MDFSLTFFEHRYLTYFSMKSFQISNMYLCDIDGGKRVSKFASLKENVVVRHRKFQFKIMYIKKDIHVQKIKVKKSLFN